MDAASRRDWETANSSNELPTFKQFLDFLQEKCRLLESLGMSETSKPTRGSYTATGQALKCSFCKNDHLIYNCKDFLKLNPKDRSAKVTKLKLCLNCLRRGHHLKDCKCQPCSKCQRRHNTLLHFSNTRNEVVSDPQECPSSENANVSNNSLHSPRDDHVNTLLSTVLVQVSDVNGQIHECIVGQWVRIQLHYRRPL